MLGWQVKQRRDVGLEGFAPLLGVLGVFEPSLNEVMCCMAKAPNLFSGLRSASVSCFKQRGSLPSKICAQICSACLRASATETFGALPIPMLIAPFARVRGVL